MKLDAEVLRYMSRDEFRVLTAIELGMRNHELVPTPLIPRIASMSPSLCHTVIKSLHKNKLIYHENKVYDGFRLTYSGYDFLALHALIQRGQVASLGHRIGVGKEADVYAATDASDRPIVLKLHRLGRISFRRIKEKRDYLGGRKATNWLYLSRLAAQREYMYLKALYEHQFPVPVPIDHSRHVIVMERVDATPFGNVRSLRHTGRVYSELMNLVIRLAEHGLIHCDFNEFNLLLDDDERITLIDFPQMVSTSHENAVEYFDRDVQCIRTYFAKRLGYHSGEYPTLSSDVSVTIELDKSVGASGSDVDDAERKEFEKHMEEYNRSDIRARRLREEKEADHDDGSDTASDPSSDDQCGNDNESDENGEEVGSEVVNESISGEENDEEVDAEAAAEAAHRERMARKDARQAAERLKQQARMERRFQPKTQLQSQSQSAESVERPPAETERVEQDDADGGDAAHSDAVASLHHAMLHSVQSKVKSMKTSQAAVSVGKSRNVVKNRAANKLRANIDAQM